MKIETAEGKTGHLLYSPIDHNFFFRIYSKDRKEFKDYKLCAEDIEIQILDSSLELYENDDPDQSNRLDWSRKVLGRPTQQE